MAESQAPGQRADTRIQALRARGAERFDPVAFGFIEALARRAATQQAPARPWLDRRLAQALAEYEQRFLDAQREAQDSMTEASERHPQAAEDLRQLWESADFSGLRRLLARLDAGSGPTPLAELLAHLERQTADDTSGAPASRSRTSPPGELKSARAFRRTWSRLRIDQQLSQALAQAPESAGPLNSHFLVLQALRLMRDISPDYLEQFAAYTEALLWLEQAGSGGGPARGRTQRRGSSEPGSP